MGPGVYFIHSAALPGMYLSPCVYMSVALIWINAVLSMVLEYTNTPNEVFSKVQVVSNVYLNN